MAAAKKKPATKEKAETKKAAAPKKKEAKVEAKAAKPKAAKTTASVAELAGLDRKGLAGRARELKRELLSIRFNIQSPNLTEYRKKRKELAKVLASLRS